MRIKEVYARVIEDSRKERTIEVSVKTNDGLFTTSSPSGKSTGKNEIPPYIKDISEEILQVEKLGSRLSEINIEQFRDLEKVEEQVKGIIGANSLYALETSIMKSLALEQGKQLWQVLNSRAKRFPFPVGNCIGGGLHTHGTKKPDFQEFLIIPRAKKFVDNVFLMKKAHEICGENLKMRNVAIEINDEGAWVSNLGNTDCLEILNNARDELSAQGEKADIGLDIASSSFYSQGKYNYNNPFKRLSEEEQRDYIAEIIDKHKIFYVEDPLNEENFGSFAKLKVLPKKPFLIVGDDLICSQVKRLEKAILNKSVNAIIVKPNQVGSLIEIAKLVAMAKKNNIVTIFSHRSGETLDCSMADLAFAFQTEFIKIGIVGKEREVKHKRMIEIEKSFD